MSGTPDFLDHGRPDVPDLVVPRGVTGFYLNNRPVRGRLVRLGALADALLERHDNPNSIKTLTGEALALTATLAAGLKFNGSFSVMAKGDGPVTLLVADCTDQGELRGYAKFDPEKLTEANDAGALLGKGYLAFTIDQGADTDRYQGLVSIQGQNLTDMAIHYFATSEQIPTHLHLACQKTPKGWRAGALILQRIAHAGGNQDSEEPLEDPDEAWRTALILADTLSDEELLDDSISPEEVLYRLFHGEEVHAERPRALAYGCRCSRAHLSGILGSFGVDDITDMAENGVITMTCEFCNLDFRFESESLLRRN